MDIVEYIPVSESEEPSPFRRPEMMEESAEEKTSIDKALGEREDA